MKSFQGDLFDLLDTVASARTYGYEDDILMQTLAEWAGKVTDDEIEAYADEVATTDEDHSQITSRLNEWRDKYQD